MEIEKIEDEKRTETETSTQSDSNVKQVVDFALEAGRILLKNGGEIFRVEETITRI